jgi:hypothetical protein
VFQQRRGALRRSRFLCFHFTKISLGKRNIQERLPERKHEGRIEYTAGRSGHLSFAPPAKFFCPGRCPAPPRERGGGGKGLAAEVKAVERPESGRRQCCTSLPSSPAPCHLALFFLPTPCMFTSHGWRPWLTYSGDYVAPGSRQQLASIPFLLAWESATV